MVEHLEVGMRLHAMYWEDGGLVSCCYGVRPGFWGDRSWKQSQVNTIRPPSEGPCEGAQCSREAQALYQDYSLTKAAQELPLNGHGPQAEILRPYPSHP